MILGVVDPRSVLTTNRYYLTPVIAILQSFFFQTLNSCRQGSVGEEGDI